MLLVHLVWIKINDNKIIYFNYKKLIFLGASACTSTSVTCSGGYFAVGTGGSATCTSCGANANACTSATVASGCASNYVVH